MSYKVEVIESYDGFSIDVTQFHPKGIVSSICFNFDQEDSVKDLVKVFDELGIEASYVESC